MIQMTKLSDDFYFRFKSQISFFYSCINQTQMSDNPAKTKLIEQHLKLKSQLKELATKMDEILEKQKERKKKKNQGNNAAEEDQRVIELKKELKDQQLRIQKNKAQIQKLRRNLDSKYDINKIVEKENELKHLKKQLSALEEEKQSLEKIRKTQDKAIKSNQDKQTAAKISRMEEELKQLTAKTKKQVEAINEKQKQIRKLHEAYIVKEEKVKEIQGKLKEKENEGKGKDKKPINNEEINEYAINQLQDQIKELQNQRIEVQKEGNQKIRALERERKQLKTELQRKKLILDQKQKQLRLNQLKHKEIIRLINTNQAAQHRAAAAEKQGGKDQAKRVVAKKGRQAPKMEGGDQDDGIIDEDAGKGKKIEKPTQKKEKKEYGFSAKNLEDDN